MSKLDKILKDYREVCFLVRDTAYLNKGKAIENSVDLLARQNIITKIDLKALMLEIIGEPTWLDESKNEWTRALRRRIEEL